jgi:sporulation protein YlmC with PRC-barrel domain
MRGADLQGKPVRREDGERLGRLREIHIQDGEVTALTCGGLGLLQRFVASQRGHRVPWADVLRITPREIVVADRARQDAR